MNVSLVIVFLLSICICHGKEQDSSPPSEILSTTKWQEKVETALEVSCPDPIDIEPCECTNDDNYLTMNCSSVQDEEQLRRVFSAFFPTTEFHTFTMNHNFGVKILEDGVFSNVSFQRLDINVCVIETVNNDALTPSLSTLTQILIQLCDIKIFPFERLAEFTSLERLQLPHNNIHTLPPLSSSSLTFVNLFANLITDLTPDVFKLLPAVEVIILDSNRLTEIPKGTFTDLPKLEYVSLFYNKISYLQSLTFDLVYTPYRPTALFLNHNDIEYVEVDTFKGVAGSVNITMAKNTLTRLPEEVWRPVMEKSITVNFAGNNLTCGCDVAWLVRDPQLLTMASDAQCGNGTLLMDLSPGDFDICG